MRYNPIHSVVPTAVARKCVRCSKPIRITYYAMSRKGNTPIRCGACGAVHSYPSMDVISPPMMPIDHGKRLSPWMDRRVRPVMPGLYEWVFSTVSSPLVLYWTTRHVTHNGQRVNLSKLVKWRGTWSTAEQANSSKSDGTTTELGDPF